MKQVFFLLALASIGFVACGSPEKEPTGADTINNDSTSKGDSSYMSPADSANNAKYVQPNSDNPPKPVEH